MCSTPFGIGEGGRRVYEEQKPCTIQCSTPFGIGEGCHGR
jgi:hypothetical protein